MTFPTNTDRLLARDPALWSFFEDHAGTPPVDTEETVTVYNRPAKVERVYSELARVRFQDNGVMDYVPREEVGR